MCFLFLRQLYKFLLIYDSRVRVVLYAHANFRDIPLSGGNRISTRLYKCLPTFWIRRRRESSGWSAGVTEETAPVWTHHPRSWVLSLDHSPIPSNPCLISFVFIPLVSTNNAAPTYFTKTYVGHKRTSPGSNIFRKNWMPVFDN